MTGKPRLGFIGIGLMGEGMTLRLPERGWSVFHDTAARLYRIPV